MNTPTTEGSISGTEEAWDNRTLGADERFVRVADENTEAEVDRALGLHRMDLVGVPVYGVELAEMVATLLQRHGYIERIPRNLEDLLLAGRAALANTK